MRKIPVLLLFFSLLSINLSAQTSERVLTLDESVTTGLKNNQRFLVLQEQIALAKQRINEARALTFPKVDFNFNFAQFNNNTPTVLSPSFNSIYLPGDNRAQYYSTGFSLWQYLYAGGRYTTNLRVAEANLSSAQSQAEVIQNEVARDVKKAFYTVLVISEKLKAYNTAIAEISQGKNTSEKESYKEKLDMEVLEIEHEYKKAKLNFLSVSGLELDTDISIDGKLEPINKEYELSKCLAWAFEYRSELQQTQFQETIDSLRVNLSITERYPTITLGANYEWIGDQFPLPKKNWSTMINLNVPIFDGWASWARIKQRKSQVREGKIRRSQIEDNIRLEVRYAYLDYGYWRDKLSVLNIDEINRQKTEDRLKGTINWLDTMEQLLCSHASLEWAIGKSLNELK